MADPFIRNLLMDGIGYAREGKPEPARHTLERVIGLSDDRDALADAWYWISVISTDQTEKRRALENALSNDLHHAKARLDLAILDGKLEAGEVIDPDAPVVPLPASGQPVPADRFTCPKCGGRMNFSPDGQSLVCEFCLRQQKPADSGSAEEQDFLLAMARLPGHMAPGTMMAFHCRGCGAEFLLAPGNISASCSFCGSNHVVALEQQRVLIPPSAILLMALDQGRASAALVEWLQRSRIQPDQNTPRPRGLYLPVWTFDLSGTVPWNGVAYRNKQPVKIHGEHVVLRNDIPWPACREFHAPLLDALPGYPLDQVQPYQPAHLAGWSARIYDIPMADAALEARRLAVQQIRSIILDETDISEGLGYSTASLHVDSFKLVLLPAWISEYRDREGLNPVLINGSNGQITAGRSSGFLAGWFKKILKG